MAVKVTADQASQKWLSRLSGATTEITQGVNAVTRAPGQQAAAQSAKWIQKVTAAQDKWKTNVGRVTLADWQQSMINTGIPRIAQGAQQKQPKFTAFMNQFLPYLQAGVAKIDTMPSTTLEDGIARATAMIRYNAQFKRTGS